MKFLRNIHTGFEYPYIQTLASNPDFVLIDDSKPVEPVEPVAVAQEPKKRARKVVAEEAAKVKETVSDDVQPANQ